MLRPPPLYAANVTKVTCEANRAVRCEPAQKTCEPPEMASRFKNPAMTYANYVRTGHIYGQSTRFQKKNLLPPLPVTLVQLGSIRLDFEN